MDNTVVAVGNCRYWWYWCHLKAGSLDVVVSSLILCWLVFDIKMDVHKMKELMLCCCCIWVEIGSRGMEYIHWNDVLGIV